MTTFNVTAITKKYKNLGRWLGTTKVAHRTVEDFESCMGHSPRLPSEWAMMGYYVLEGWKPTVGTDCDYYTHLGAKRYGRVMAITSEIIVIRDYSNDEMYTFMLRHGRT